MRNKKRKRSSVMDDEDNIPLKSMKRKCQRVDSNSYDSLILPKSEPCELCERVSSNRFNSLIHNVRHIIIPLIKQTVYQCSICLHHFTSQTDLKTHKSKKHSLTDVPSTTELVRRTSYKQEEEPYESDLILILKKEEEGIVDETVPHRTGSESVVSECSSGGFSLKNRLVFEEDIISVNCDRLLSDLTTDCQVKVEIFPPIWNVQHPKSIHYDELIKPGVFRCKICGKNFPSRYEAIKHESHHLVIRDSLVTFCKICNQYILGDNNKLMHHKLTVHSKIEHPPKLKADVVPRSFGGKLEENGVADEPYTTKTKTLKLCEICFSFCRNKSSQNYDCIGELSEMGKRYTCEKCGYKFFEVKLVKREIKYKYSSFAKKKNRVGKGMSNETRLKIISQRFKMMKKKYYFVLFTKYPFHWNI